MCVTRSRHAVQVPALHTVRRAASSSPPKWQPPGNFGKENMHLSSAPSRGNTSSRRTSRSLGTRSVTSRRTVSPADSTHSADTTQHGVLLPGAAPSTYGNQGSPSWTHAAASTPTTVSRVCTGALGFTQRVWYAVVHAADSWWSKFRAVMRGVLRCAALCCAAPCPRHRHRHRLRLLRCARERKKYSWSYMLFREPCGAVA